MQDAPHTLKHAIIQGDRAALARAITLVESTRADHQEQAQQLLQALLPETGGALRIGITGVPGVGKSTFIEALGMHVIERGHKVAVLAVDPSSSITGGSILGDKTRMQYLALQENAFIRPSPTGGTLGGVARRTREVMLLCEAAGYDVVIVETVGVGQSETQVADMVDMFTLLLLPGSGDELQGIKRGIVELADLMIVNKADGDLLPQAKRVKADYTAALRMVTPASAWRPRVELCSALLGDGVADVWKLMTEFRDAMEKGDALERKRAEQAIAWMWKEVRETLLESFSTAPEVIRRIAVCEREVAASAITATQAARTLLAAYRDAKP